MQVLSDLLLQALERPPCVVMFSGGRDSSALLALASALARQHGLEAPVAYTNRVPTVESSREDDWQHLVIRHVGVSDWEVRRWDDELDTIGPFAQRCLLRVGVGSPSNLHFTLPAIDSAAGGSVVTGSGGDELFGLVARTVAARVVYRDRRLTRKDWGGVGAQLAPAWFRRRRMRPPVYGWLTPAAKAQLDHEYSAWMADQPFSYSAALLKWWWPSRVIQVSQRYSQNLGAIHGTLVVNPFASAPFLSTFAARYGHGGPLGRRAFMDESFGELLPQEVRHRTSKAGFLDVFHSTYSKQFAREWNGSGVDERLVDPHLLREEWLKPEPDPHSLVPLQMAWLASQDS